MSAHFKLAEGKKLGYAVAEVDQLISTARSVFANPSAAVDDEAFIRHAQFTLAKGGYDIASVDAALDRLDDSYSEQLAKAQVTRLGYSAAQERASHLREALLNRIQRGAKKHFESSGALRLGYQKKQVDSALSAINAHLQSGAELNFSYIRELRFKPVRGGYEENQVDAYLDRVIELLHLEKVLLATPRW